MLRWPELADLVGLLDLGDGSTADQTTSTHTFPGTDDAVYAINGSLQTGGATLPVSGAVARTNARAITALNGFTLTDPSLDVAVQVIRSVMPAFYYAFEADTLAVASDPTGMAKLRFDRVATTSITRGADGAFTGAPLDFTVEVSGPGGTATGLIVHVLGATWSGRFDGGALASPLALQGQLVLEDVVTAAQVLAGLDHDTAAAFLAGLFGYDPASPPVTVPFRGEPLAEAAP